MQVLLFRFLKSEIIDKTNEGLSHFETDSFYCLHLVILFKIVKSGHIVYTKLKDKYSYCKRQEVYIKRRLHMKNWLLTLILALVLTILSACQSGVGYYDRTACSDSYAGWTACSACGV